MAEPSQTTSKGARFPFRRAMRVRSGSHFQRAYRNGNRARSGRLVVVACPNGLQHARLGLSVGKRIWKQAVRRNRLRRLFREAFRLTYPNLPGGYDYILIPAVPRCEPSLADLCADLEALGPKAVRRSQERQQGSDRAEGERR